MSKTVRSIKTVFYIFQIHIGNKIIKSEINFKSNNNYKSINVQNILQLQQHTNFSKPRCVPTSYLFVYLQSG